MTETEPTEPTEDDDRGPEPEDRRDEPMTDAQRREQSLAWLRKIRAEHELPIKPNVRSGRD